VATERPPRPASERRPRFDDSGDRESLVAAGRRDGTVTVWNGGDILHRFDERSPVTALALSRDGRIVAAGGEDGVSRVRETTSGKLLFELPGHGKRITGIAFSANRRLIATSSEDKDVRIWRAADGHLLHRLRAHSATVFGVAFSPDSRWVVSAGPITAGMWRSDDGKFLAYLRGHRKHLVGAGMTRDGRVITASIDGTVRVYACDVCGGIDDLLALARRRLAATGVG